MNRPAVLRWFAMASCVVAFLGVLVIGVFPVRDFRDQRAQTAAVRAELAQVEARNAEYTEQVVALQTDAEIERLARAEYGLVYPGEEAYTILPAPAAEGVPGPWPFAG